MEYSSDFLWDALEYVGQSGIPGPDSAVAFDIGTGPYLRFFEEEFIVQGVKNGNSVCRFIEGPFGAGKTHLLQLIENLGRQHNFAIARLDLSQELNITEWDQITKFVLENISFAADGAVCKGLPEVLSAICRQNNNSDVLDLTHTKLSQPGFAAAMQYMVHANHKSQDYRQLLSRFLSGQKVLASDIKRAGLKGVKGNLTARNAEQIFRTTLNGLYALGIPTMILLDENERTLVSAPGKSNSRYNKAANLMRRLIDACASGSIHGSVIVFTVLPNFIRMCAEDYPALGQRLRAAPPEFLRPSWRTPVLDVAEVNTVQAHEKFAEHAVVRFREIAEQLGVVSNGLSEELQQAADSVLERNAGAGFRRELMKSLANKLLRANKE